MTQAPPRRLLRHAVTVLLVALYSAVLAPVIATVLLSARANGPTPEILLAPVLSPLLLIYAGPGVFLLGLAYGWMLVVLVLAGLNWLPLRVGLAMLLAALTLALAPPPSETPPDLADWLIWTATAAITALAFTRTWLDRRVGRTEEGA